MNTHMTTKHSQLHANSIVDADQEHFPISHNMVYFPRASRQRIYCVYNCNYDAKTTNSCDAPSLDRLIMAVEQRQLIFPSHAAYCVVGVAAFVIDELIY
jgi:hypothetical protein